MRFHWPHASTTPHLQAGEAHVWAVSLKMTEDRLQLFTETLSRDELSRAQAFKIEGLGPRFIAAHGALRMLLGRYLNERPEKLAFTLEHRGKPCLAAEHSAGRLRFNLSHSADLALMAIVNDCEIGVDVEQVREVKELEHLAQRYFHPAEVDDVMSAGANRNVAFFRHWTAKEAVLKAFGSGITERLDHFQVPPSETSSGRVDVSGMPNFVKASQCWVTRIAPCDNFEAAVAFLGPERRVQGLVFDVSSIAR
jgi:4'-phosphopantetheinyl transferase